MTPEDIAETVYIRLSETDDRGEHIRIIAGAIKDAYERAAVECHRLGQNALHNATVHYHHGNEADSEACEAQACAIAEVAAAIRALGVAAAIRALGVAAAIRALGTEGE